jgi:hypothetical protein
MATTRRVRDLLDQLAAAEANFLHAEFLAPALRDGVVHVRVAGVVCRLRVEGDFVGWGVFRTAGPAAARLVRPASPDERRRYLALWPRRRLILCQPAGRGWLALPADGGDAHFRGAGPLPVRFVREGRRFDVIAARYDGVQCWFEEPDGHADRAAAAFLREALHLRAPAEQVRRPGLTAGQRAAYAWVYERRRWADRDLFVQSAGVCLGTADRRLDVGSLVGVFAAVCAQATAAAGAADCSVGAQTPSSE